MSSRTAVAAFLAASVALVSAALPAAAQIVRSTLSDGADARAAALPADAPLLLRRPDVRRELELSAAQTAALDRAARARADRRAEQDRRMDEAIRAGKFRPLPERVVTLPAAGRRPLTGAPLQPQGMVRIDLSVSGADLDSLAAVLNGAQRRRLWQLHAQRLGPFRATADPAIADRLKLSAATRARIHEIGLRAGGRAAAPRGSMSPEERRGHRARAIADAETEILAALSPEERARWKAFVGRPFVFSDPPPPPGGTLLLR